MKITRAGVLALALMSLVGCAMSTASEPEFAADGVAVQNVPQEYQTWVVRAGSMCQGITGPIIAAQIDTESSWNPQAVSPVGAQGLSQFMPTTWPSWGQDDDGNGTTSPFDPGDAIMAQARYDCALLAEVKQMIATGAATGDPLDLALAAYNAGSNRIRQYGGMPPFAETRAYVPRIKELAATKYTSRAMASLPSGGSIGSRIVAAAIRWVGTPYVWGGGGPQGPSGVDYVDGRGPGFDCSGLVQYAVYQGTNGAVTLRRTAREQCTTAGIAVPADLAVMQPGDIIGFDNGGRVPGCDHIGIYIGNGQMVHSPQSTENVQIGRVDTGYYSNRSQWHVRRIVSTATSALS